MMSICFPRESASWFSCSAGTLTSFGPFTPPSKTSCIISASETLDAPRVPFYFCFCCFNAKPLVFRPTIKHLIEIYYRAWKKATGEFKEKIESVCIQDYMKNAILLHRSSPVISKVRMVGFKSSAVVTCTPCCLFHPKKIFLCRFCTTSTRKKAATLWKKC